MFNEKTLEAFRYLLDIKDLDKRELYLAIRYVLYTWRDMSPINGKNGQKIFTPKQINLAWQELQTSYTTLSYTVEYIKSLREAEQRKREAEMMKQREEQEMEIQKKAFVPNLMTMDDANKELLKQYQFNESKQRLNEITIKDKYLKEKDHTKWNPQDFETICQADPTYNREKNICGKLTNWMLAKLNDVSQLNTLRAPLEWYTDGIKKNILQRQGISPDINKYKTVDAFLEAMHGVMSNNDNMSQSEYNNREKLNGQYDVIASNNYYDIIAPKTFEAERYFGSGTEWCTVANKNYFDNYTRKDQLFIFYPKDGDKHKKMQFHKESDSYATYDDDVCDTPKKCIVQCADINHMDESFIEETLVLSNENGFPKGQYIRLNEVEDLLSQGVPPKEIFDYVGNFNHDYAAVKLNNKYTFIKSIDNGKFKLLKSNLWFDDMSDFYNGYARVRLDDKDGNKKWSFINTDGNYIKDNLWFDWVNDFYNGYAQVMLYDKDGKEKYFFINMEGNFYDIKTMQPIDPNTLFESKKTKTVFLTEEQMDYIKKHNSKPYYIDPDKVNIVKKYLDNGFKRCSLHTISDDGYPQETKIVAMIGTDGNPLRNMTDVQLFYLLQDRFQHMFADLKQRDNFLKQIIKDWYANKITKDGLLSVNILNEDVNDSADYRNAVSKVNELNILIQKYNQEYDTEYLFYNTKYDILEKHFYKIENIDNETYISIETEDEDGEKDNDSYDIPEWKLFYKDEMNKLKKGVKIIPFKKNMQLPPVLQKKLDVLNNNINNVLKQGFDLGSIMCESVRDAQYGYETTWGYKDFKISDNGRLVCTNEDGEVCDEPMTQVFQYNEKTKLYEIDTDDFLESIKYYSKCLKNGIKLSSMEDKSGEEYENEYENGQGYQDDEE